MEKNEHMEWSGMRIDPATLFYDIIRNWWVILLGAIGAAMLTWVVVSYRYVPNYTTSATFVVSNKENSNSYNNWAATAGMAKTFQGILKSNTLNSIICEEMGVDFIDATIGAETLGDSNLLVLSVTAHTSREAMKIIRVIIDNYTNVSYYMLGTAVMDILEQPSVPLYPDNTADALNQAKRAFILMTAALVCLFGCVSVLQDTVKVQEDVEKKLDARSLGAIPFDKKRKTIKETLTRKKSALLITNPLAGFALVESYRKLATKVDYQMKRRDAKALVVTSVAENEGKSTVAANLALALAAQSKKVLLIDGDLRRPAQFLIFNRKPNEYQELGEYLKGKVDLKKAVSQSQIPNLYLAIGRNSYPSSTELLSHKELKMLIEAAKSVMDYVIIDSPPIGQIGDAELLTHSAGAAMLVAKQNYMLAEDINDMLDDLRSENTKVLGVVLNGVRSFNVASNKGNYGKYGKYGKYSKQADVKKDRGN